MARWRPRVVARAEMAAMQRQSREPDIAFAVPFWTAWKGDPNATATLLYGQITSSGDAVAAGENSNDGLGVGNMFLFQDAGRERMLIILGQYRHRALKNDDAMIELFVDKVDGASGDGSAILERLPLCIQAGKGGKQRRMDIEDARRKGTHKIRREKAHIAGQADKIHLMLPQAGDDFSIMLGAPTAAGLDDRGWNAQIARGGNARRVRPVGNDDSDLSVWNTSGGKRLRDGKEVRSPSGEQNPQPVIAPGRRGHA